MDKNRHAVDIFNKHAQLYQDKYMNVNAYASYINYFCNQLAGNKVLDIACGPGNISSFIKKQFSNIEITGIDLAENMLQLAINNVPDIITIQKDIRDISTITSQTFHGIVASFCIPYLNLDEVTRLFLDCYNLLYNNGILYLSTMENKPEKSGYEYNSKGDSVYISYYSKRQIIDLLELHGFEIITCGNLATTNKNASEHLDLIIIAKNR